MASIRREVVVDAAPEKAWAAVAAWGALHERLVPGFVVDTRLDGDDRIVTFFTGTVLREVLVACDEGERRLVWSVVDGPYTHHNGALQVHAHDGGGARLVWTADLLPDETAPRTAEMMERGLATARETLGSP
jgi:hypothetical protein